MAGFTLIEVMVALVIFLVMALGLSGLTKAVLQANTSSNMRANAALAAASVAEQLQARLASSVNTLAALRSVHVTAQTVSFGPDIYTVQVISASASGGVNLLTAGTASSPCPWTLITSASWADGQNDAAPTRSLQISSVLLPRGCGLAP